MAGDETAPLIYEEYMYTDEPEREHHPVKKPAHYQHPSGIEAIQITKYESFLRGNVIKYVLRAPYKGEELQDMLKARQYLDWEIERLEVADRHSKGIPLF